MARDTRIIANKWMGGRRRRFGDDDGNVVLVVFDIAEFGHQVKIYLESILQ